jgi:hypothetical protein
MTITVPAFATSVGIYRPRMLLVVRVPGSRREMYCDSCEVLTEFIYVM